MRMKLTLYSSYNHIWHYSLSDRLSVSYVIQEDCPPLLVRKKYQSFINYALVKLRISSSTGLSVQCLLLLFIGSLC